MTEQHAPALPPWPENAPRWLKIAALDIGLREIPGTQHAPRIQSWLRTLGAWWDDDETPWCGVAVAAWMRESGVVLPKHWYRAKAWGDGWGRKLNRPITGCVVVFDRAGGGHVGLLSSVSENGSLNVLGGNQGNEVNIRNFPLSRNPAFYWPPGEPIHEVGQWMTTVGSAPSSTGEA